MTRKTAVFEEWSWLKFHNFGLAVGTNLKFYTSVPKGLKLKVRKFWELIPTFVEVTGEKLLGGPFCSPVLNRVKNTYFEKHLRMTASVINPNDKSISPPLNLNYEKGQTKIYDPTFKILFYLIYIAMHCKLQKQTHRGVPGKRCSENPTSQKSGEHADVFNRTVYRFLKTNTIFLISIGYL